MFYLIHILFKIKIPGVLAALDATKESSIGVQYGVKGYPTVKYFANGEFMFDVNVRDADKIVEFMKVLMTNRFFFCY